MNERGWKAEVWGTRGSYPVPEKNFMEYGGHTSCISVDCGDTLVVLDAGSGLIPLGERLVREKRRRADILISHAHLDHIQGLFAFPLLYLPAGEVHIYASPDVVRELPHIIAPPLWPVDLTGCRAKVLLHEIWTGKPFRIEGGPAVTALRGSHPGGCGYYRLEGGGHSLVCALDCELEGDMAPRLIEFAQGADLLIWDAGFTAADFKPGWGHSTWTQGLELGRAAGVGQILMTHYNTSYSDEFLREQEALAAEASALIRFAREGMVIDL